MHGENWGCLHEETDKEKIRKENRDGLFQSNFAR